jgi:hypothetical protein
MWVQCILVVACYRVLLENAILDLRRTEKENPFTCRSMHYLDDKQPGEFGEDLLLLTSYKLFLCTCIVNSLSK